MPALPTILMAIVVVAAGAAVAFVLGMRTQSPLVLRPLVWVSRRVMNPAQMRTAGTPGAYAGIIRHRGRVSGRAYETPVGIVPTDDAFLIALPYGASTQWLRNVMAARRAELVVEGATHQVDRPELIPTADVVDAFSATDQRLFRWLAVDRCLRLRPVDAIAEREAAVAA